MFVGISIQTYYSIQHVQAAAYFVRRASRLERRSAVTPGCPKLNVAIQGYASASLFAMVSFLEALANELFADAAKPDGGHLSVLDPRIRGVIAELGQIESVEKASVTSKFDVLLRAAGLQPVQRDRTPGQDLATAIRLRNELVHYKAAWFDMGTPGIVRPGNFSESKLAQQIRGRFSGRYGARGPDSWLGGGCAKWALTNAIAYTDEVFSRLSITPLYEHVRSELALAE